MIGIDGCLVGAHRLAVFYMTGLWPVADVDHLYGDRDDNRWSRLQPKSRAGNMQNATAPHRDNRTGLRGVIPSGTRFAAQIRSGGKNRHLGVFDTPEQAHAVYLAEKRIAHPGWVASEPAR